MKEIKNAVIVYPNIYILDTNQTHIHLVFMVEVMCQNHPEIVGFGGIDYNDNASEFIRLLLKYVDVKRWEDLAEKEIKAEIENNRITAIQHRYDKNIWLCPEKILGKGEKPFKSICSNILEPAIC